MTLKSDEKFGEKLTCCLENDMRNLEFSPEHSKVSKLELWWDPFAQSRNCMTLKFTEKLCHDNGEWYKNWKRTDLSF